MFGRTADVKHARLLDAYQALQYKHDREVSEHRAVRKKLFEAEDTNALILAQVEAARYKAEEMVANVAIAFGYLHQVAFPQAGHVTPTMDVDPDAVI